MSELQRLVLLVPYLRAHPGVTVDEVAREFGVTPKRVLADLGILQYVGLPGGFYGDLFEVDLGGAREYGDIFVRNVDALGRPMRLGRDEAASLMAALQVVMDLGGDDEGARSALAKLEAVTSLRPDAVEVEVATGDADVVAALKEALADGRVVQLDYRTGGRGSRRRAEVEPARLRTDGGYAYLDAWSRTRDGWRSHRLDRIDRVEILDEHVPPRDVPASLDTWFSDAGRELTVTVTNAGRWCADYHPTTAVERVDDGWRITFPLVSIDWAARLLLRLGSAVTEVSDPAVTEAARSLAREALAHYGGVL